MSTSDTSSPAVMRLGVFSLLMNMNACMEVETNVAEITKDALARKTKVTSFQPPFTDTSAWSELIRGVAFDYEKDTLLLDGLPLLITDIKCIHPERTVLRVKIGSSGKLNLPSTVIVKQQKSGWEDEFAQEIAVYKKLESFQGRLVPYFLGQGLFNDIPAIILSEVDGITLHDFARKENAINAFQLLSAAYGCLYWDQRLDNFMLLTGNNCEDGDVNVMVVDLEQVEFPNESSICGLEVNDAAAPSLMGSFRDIQSRSRECRAHLANRMLLGEPATSRKRVSLYWDDQ
ncbi:hypothetical protein N7456_011186 [Penicillium angulare]|uniref:Protein kinase-like domain n=1 Tax=Penicillium angulare TaxID=116970 RepID=A0A9W9JZT7_9EURO|nr:hypothetical protein N7456_011186 [Penicillium angulare]